MGGPCHRSRQCNLPCRHRRHPGGHLAGPPRSHLTLNRSQLRDGTTAAPFAAAAAAAAAAVAVAAIRCSRSFAPARPAAAYAGPAGFTALQAGRA